MTSLLFYKSISAICEQSSHCGTGQLFGSNCQSSAGNPRRMNLQRGVQTSSTVSHFSNYFHISPGTHCTLESKGCFTTLWCTSNCETELFNHLSDSIYLLQKEKGSSPSFQKICYLLWTNSKSHFARSKEMNTRDSAGCWCWLVQKANIQKHIPKQSRDKPS